MAPLNQFELSPGSMQVSGFYGPGAWAAWIITMFASWIHLLRDDYTHNLHIIGYALYTDWAAIDFIRHVIPALWQDQHDLSDQDRARFDNIAASIAVIQLGVYQAVAQQVLFTVNRLRQHEPIAHAKLKDRRRSMILCVGSMFPVFFVTVASFFHASVTVVPPQMLYLADLPARCYFVPCAPQGIGEWDQAFALVVALYFFLYEFGYEIFRIVRKAAQGVWTIWQRVAK